MRKKAIYHHRTQATDAQGIHINEMVNAFIRQGIDIKMVALVQDEALGQESREGVLGRISNVLPSLVYELMEIGFNIPGVFRLYRAAVKERPSFIYERYSIYNLAGLVVSRLTGIPLIEEVNAPLAHEKKIYGSLHFPGVAQFIETLIINGSSRTIAVTEALKKMLVHKGADEKNIVVMPNGINLGDYPVDAAGKDGTKVVLGFIGWFREWHGLEFLIEIFAARKWHEKNIRLLLVGDGPLRGILENNIIRLGLENYVTITGAVPRDRLGDYLDQMNIALQPAATSYACPMKLIEYMAASKAIVAPDQPNIRELLVHGENGLLFEPGDVDDLARQIESLLADGVIISRLGRIARKTVETKPLSWDYNAVQVMGLIPSL